MTEPLTALLDHYADAMSDGLVPPARSGSMPRSAIRRRWQIALPAMAVASVLAVVAGVTLLGQGRSGPAVIEVAAAATPQPTQPGDTPPPLPVLLPDLPGRASPPPPPPGRDKLTVSLELPSEAVVEKLTAYTVVIGNVSSDSVSLRPCPDYQAEYGGQGFVGRLPCDDLPDVVEPGQQLRITLATEFGYWDGPDMPSRTIDVAWGIGGPPAARGQLKIMPLDLGPPIAVAPFSSAPAPPGEPVDGTTGLTHGMRPEWRLTPTIIAAPESVRAGETLRYTVRLVNVDPKDAVPLSPCRGFTQWMQRPVRPAGEQVAFLDWSFERGEITSLVSEEHLLNCDALPAEIPPRHWVQLEMAMKVPASYAPGSTSLAWKVGELDVFGSMQSRYVTVDVLPPA